MRRIVSEVEEREIEAIFQENRTRVRTSSDTIRLQLQRSYPVRELFESPENRAERLGHEWRFYPMNQSQRAKREQKYGLWLLSISIILGLIFFPAWAVFMILVMKGR